MKRQTSGDGFSLIKKWETFVGNAYQDSVGVWTIGYGHTRTAHSDATISIDVAIILLKQDVSIVEAYINLHFKELRQCQFDALVSLLYNIGTGSFLKTRLYAELKSNPDGKNVADEWIEFRNAGGKYLRGLMRRRIDELALYYSW